MTDLFTKKKFQSLPIERQHKKCSELLKNLYENFLYQKPVDFYYDQYQLMQKWMSLDQELTLDIKHIADRFHYHLKLSRQLLKENNLLPSIKQGDREQGCEIWPIAVYLDHLRSAHNVGSIIRTVEAFALGSIYFSEQTPYVDNKQVKDASMGTFQWVQCFTDKRIDELPKPLIVMETSTQAHSIYDFVFPQSFTVALGNEEYGCTDEILKLADVIIEIPLRGRKNSLNVANAFAIAASEIQRQKKGCYEKKINC